MSDDDDPHRNDQGGWMRLLRTLGRANRQVLGQHEKEFVLGLVFSNRIDQINAADCLQNEFHVPKHRAQQSQAGDSPNLPKEYFTSPPVHKFLHSPMIVERKARAAATLDLNMRKRLDKCAEGLNLDLPLDMARFRGRASRIVKRDRHLIDLYLAAIAQR